MKRTIKKSSLINILLGTILTLATLIRFYRITDLLGFFYDQGRDALVIWDLIHKGKLFLIGPMMGFTGIFRGPWYYWLITPFYWLGGGNPLWPSAFLIISSVAAIYLLYRIGKETAGEKTGLIAAFIASVSYYVVSASRWLSNPTPMLVISMLLLWAVFQFLKKKAWPLPLIAFLIGLGLNFGAATELFYIPVIIVILVWKRKYLPGKLILALSGFAFLLTFAPQVLFEIRHPGVFLSAINKFLIEDKSFTLSFWEIVKTRASFYYGLFSSKFWINGGGVFAPFFVIVFAYLAIKRREFWSNEKFRIIFIFALAPILGTLFFRGNQGNFYEYYFTGYYLIFILLFSVILSKLSGGLLGKIVLAVFLLILIFKNYSSFIKFFGVSLANPEVIAFSNQLAAIDWIYNDAKTNKFNTDFYVPPVIPYAYEYLFKWYGTTKYKFLPETERVPLLYTLYEVDLLHPERLQAWKDRQITIGRIEKEERFGGIVVQKRLRNESTR